VDQSYFYIKEETSGEYWSYIYHNIADENREQIFNIVRAYFLAVSTNLVTSVCKAFDRIKMDEAENSAFMMLLFTNPSSLSVLSDQTRTLLREWKNKTLAGIAQHIERTGRDVHERMGEIIFLLTEFQVVKLLKSKSTVKFLGFAYVGEKCVQIINIIDK
jgi:predicted transcriptional regulator